VQEERDREARRADVRDVAWLAREYVATEAKPKIKTWRAVERTLERHWLPAIGPVPAAEVTRRQLREVLRRLVAQGKPGAAGEARKA
jgi:hypothetical protein